MIAGIFLQFQKTGAERHVIDDLINISAADPRFLRRRRESEREGGGDANLLLGQIFAQNSIKMK